VRPVRIRTGVARFDDGWNVVIEFDGRRKVCDPTFTTEAEAEAKAQEVAAELRATMRDVGLVVL
jgi:hypothetical protein